MSPSVTENGGPLARGVGHVTKERSSEGQEECQPLLGSPCLPRALAGTKCSVVLSG